MVSAELIYRNNVPFNYLAIETSEMYFYGDSELVGKLNKLARLVRFDKYEENNIRIEKLREHKMANLQEWLEWQREIKTFKCKHLFWMFDEDLREELKILRTERDRLAEIDERFDCAITQANVSKCYTTTEVTEKFKTLLAKLGFECNTVTRSESKLINEKYQSTCSDEELNAMVDSMIEGLETAQAKKQAQIKELYSSPTIIDSSEVLLME